MKSVIIQNLCNGSKPNFHKTFLGWIPSSKCRSGHPRYDLIFFFFCAIRSSKAFAVCSPFRHRVGKQFKGNNPNYTLLRVAELSPFSFP